MGAKIWVYTEISIFFVTHILKVQLSYRIRPEIKPHKGTIAYIKCIEKVNLNIIPFSPIFTPQNLKRKCQLISHEMISDEIN